MMKRIDKAKKSLFRSNRWAASKNEAKEAEGKKGRCSHRQPGPAKLTEMILLGVNRSPHVVAGSGAGRTEGMLGLLHERGFKGRFTIEHGNWTHNLGEVRETVQFFDYTSAMLTQGVVGE
jgi:hypothetical protein